jgi:ABC-2 type transport system permease protein
MNTTDATSAAMKPTAMKSTTLTRSTMRWLLQREFWEYKGAMFWAPLIVAAVIVVLLGGTLSYGLAAHGVPHRVWVNGHMVSQGTLAAAADQIRPVAAKIASGLYLVAAAPPLIMLIFVVFSYCLGTLYDERRDRSILFWKSLPVSDATTVLSKVAMALCVAPLIAIALGVAASLLLVLIACAALSANGVNLFGVVFGARDFYLAPLGVVALLPVYIVWALPTVGWLLLVSSWARTKPFLWAVGAPAVMLIVAKWINAAMTRISGTEFELARIVSDVVTRLLTGVVPGIWFAYPGAVPGGVPHADDGIDVASVFTQSWGSLASVDAILGALAGAAMIYGAMRMRRWRDEG